jgi:hypothetical protein
MLSYSDLQELRGVEEAEMAYTYTRVTRALSGPANAWGEPTEAASVPVAGLPCTLQLQDGASYDDRGGVSVNTSTLYVPISDPLKAGDIVRDVTMPLTAPPTVVMSGDWLVLQVDLLGEGAPIVKRASLRGGRTYDAEY